MGMLPRGITAKTPAITRERNTVRICGHVDIPTGDFLRCSSCSHFTIALLLPLDERATAEEAIRISAIPLVSAHCACSDPAIHLPGNANIDTHS